ncbi:RNA-directed DNA polymerase [Streptococcus salivarius]|jgi:hypothetical protein|uniref:RNA-directed DNA polymerase n=1 Tax=Streptococcus salivarius TaxID=1304 RepID=UPI0012BBB148|nr:RNA-directed DNA polymerase [Streptococcus salivarius]MCB7034224.1 RNA-directed DNA polymerase [Streptococcus salivarius]MTQ29643.1 hypothetical protein [Streptococcus salivarius]MTQ36637.1 hypothetical protein [Streptococcus salivarius]MTQ44030.1 hypothetical protein [Streptococcus salivarius]MTQ45539.1 hypothetical protein [Streptococcus salivarius]
MKKNEEKCVLDMTSMEARAFFLKSSSYFSGNLPTYFDFTSILNEVSKIMDGKKLNDVWYRKPGNYRNVNRKIIMNKDGKYAWRQLQIIHPFIYVDLVNLITEEKNWNLVRKRFSEFDNTSNASKIRCISIPKQSKSKLSDIGNTILGWWKNSEQALIKYSLDFDYCLQTDVTDCYPSIYTHSISWALHGINVAKSNRSLDLLGNKIDKSIQSMQNMQTNGIPQGSVLMDFIAEMILGYSDKLLSEELSKEGINNYQIVRYRDDYKIFSDSKEDVEKILKTLSIILYDLNLKLNSAKTYLYDDIILDGIKPDKLYWTTKYESFVDYFPTKKDLLDISNKDIPREEDDIFDDLLNKKEKKRPSFKISIQKHLLEIKIMAEKYPNCGQLKKSLTDLYLYRIKQMSKMPDDVEQIVSILVSIMIKNPTTIQHCVVILGRILEFYKNEPKQVSVFISKILKKYSKLPNTDLVEIWLQRFTVLLNADEQFSYQSNLCQFVNGNSDVSFWNSEWLKKEYRTADKWHIDKSEKENLSFITSEKEIYAFSKVDYDNDWK